MMKKLLLVLFIAMVLNSFHSKAQLGVHVGYNFAKVSGLITPSGYSEKYLSNITGGLFYDKNIIPLLGLRIGVMYSPKGSNFTNNGDFQKMTLNYIELPVLARIKLGPVYALGGFYGAYAMNGKSIIKISGVENSDNLDFDANKIKKLDYGMKFGLGVQYGLGPIHIFAQGDYSMGLQNINDASGNELKNNTIGVSAGVLLGFK